MRLTLRLRFAGAAVGSLVACAPSPGPAPLPAAGPRGPGIVFYYQQGDALRRFDTRNASDTSLARLSRADLDAGVSPDGAVLAVGFVAQDSARLTLIELPRGIPRPLHAASRALSYSLEWSPDGTALVAAYASARRQGEIVSIAPRDGARRSIGCTSSRMVHAWLRTGSLVVGDGRTQYVVDARTCRTLATISTDGKRQIAYSPDGTRFSYFRTARVRDRAGRSSNVVELRVATLDGSDDFKVIGDRYDPQRARWSPDGKYIALDVQSQQTRGLRHVALFDLNATRVQFFASQTSGGAPRDTDPHWSPDGTRIVHDRHYTGSGGRSGAGGRRGGEKIVRTLTLDPGAVQVAPAVVMSGEIGTTWGWADNSHAVVTSPQWVKVINVDGGPEYMLPAARRVIHVAVVR